LMKQNERSPVNFFELAKVDLSVGGIGVAFANN